MNEYEYDDDDEGKLSDAEWDEINRQGQEGWEAYALSDPARFVRKATLCGECKSSTFLVWNAAPLDSLGVGAEDIQKHEDRKGMTRFKITELEGEIADEKLWRTFVVRCAFFRMNVADPLEVVDCEAFRQRKQVSGDDDEGGPE